MDIREYARQEALRQGVDPGHILPLIGTESSWNGGAVSPKGAAGLMQLMPATARDLGLSDADRFNPAKAIPAGIRYFKQQLDRFGSPELAYAAYNAGPGAVSKAGGVPAISETQNYVRKNAMADKGSLSLDDATALLQGGQGSGKALSLDSAAALLAQPDKPAKKPLKMASQPVAPINPLDGYGVIDRTLIGAGKAATDFLHGIGIGDALGLARGDEKADKALMSDTAGMAGNLLGQAGILYAGGKGVQLLGRGAQALTAGRSLTPLGSAVQRGGQLLQSAGNAVINPTSYKQAATVGSGFGAVAQPGDLSQRLENAAAGAAGGALGVAAGRGLTRAGQAVKSALTPSGPVEASISAQLSAKGIDFHALPRELQQQVVKIGKRSLDDIGKLDADQLARSADFEALGIKPTRGWITRDPKDWWLENNLNTVDDQLAARFKDANQSLLQGVRSGSSDATDYTLGRRLQDTVTGHDAALKANADSLYDAARNAAGRDIPLDPHRFVNAASTELDQQMLGSKLPSDTLSWFQKATSGQEPFDMGTALQRLQAINGRLYSTNDRAEAAALGIVKKHLVDAIDGYGGPVAGGLPRTGADPQQQLADAFRQARSAAADRFRFQESSPLVENVLKGKYTPEKLPDMLGSMKVDDLRKLASIQSARGVPVMDTLRDAAKAYVRDAATLQSETGGSFTVAGMRKALDKIGPEKGALLFGPDGWAQYQRILRSAGNIMNAPMKPAGSPTFANFMRFVNGMGNVPFLGKPVNAAIWASGKGKQMMDVGRALNPAFNLANPSVPSARGLPLLTTPGLLTWTETQR